MSKDTCIKANTYCPVHKGIVGADCWHDSKDFSVPRTDWKQIDEIVTLREQVKKLEALVVMRCDLDVPPQFSQGLQSHEVLEPVTAEHCQWFVAKIEKLTKERDELHRAFNQPVQRSEWEKMQEQLAALAEQNAKMRKVLLRLACLGNGDQYGNSIGNCIAQEALSLPNLATPPVSEDRWLPIETAPKDDTEQQDSTQA